MPRLISPEQWGQTEPRSTHNGDCKASRRCLHIFREREGEGEKEKEKSDGQRKREMLKEEEQDVYPRPTQ